MLWLFTFSFSARGWRWTTFQLAVALAHSYLCLIRSSHRRCSVRKKVFLEILQNSQENTCARGSFLIKLQAWACNFISGTGVFLWILRNFKQHLFYRTPPGDCFCLIECWTFLDCSQCFSLNWSVLLLKWVLSASCKLMQFDYWWQDKSSHLDCCLNFKR